MKSVYVVMILILISLNVHSQVDLVDRGKGFYVDNEGAKHEGFLVLKFAKHFSEEESLASLQIKYQDGNEEKVKYDDIQRFTIGKTEYTKREELSMVANLGTEFEAKYDLKNVFLRVVTDGRISYYVHYMVIGSKLNNRGLSTKIFLKENKEFNMDKCQESKKLNYCLIELMKDEPTIYEKYRKRARFYVHSETTIKKMYEDYNSNYTP
jgi:hypothetical protein